MVYGLLPLIDYKTWAITYPRPSSCVPQGCVLCATLFILFTHDCTRIHLPPKQYSELCQWYRYSGAFIQRRGGYREEVQPLVKWCSDNDLVLTAKKTKEIIVDSRRYRRTTHLPFQISDEEAESINNIMFLGIHITKDRPLTPSTWWKRLKINFSSQENSSKPNFSFSS